MQVDFNTGNKSNKFPKYDLEEQVIFLNLNNLKLYAGTIKSYATYVSSDAKSCVYSILENRQLSDGFQQLIQNVPEPCVFKSRDEVLNWAIDVANQEIK